MQISHGSSNLFVKISYTLQWLVLLYLVVSYIVSLIKFLLNNVPKLLLVCLCGFGNIRESAFNFGVSDGGGVSVVDFRFISH